MISLYIPGEPVTVTAQQKGVSVVRGRPHFYTKSSVLAAKKRIEEYVPRQSAPMDGPVQVTVTFMFPRRRQDREDLVAMFCRPDVDNLIKLLFDVMTKQGYWHDDGQISDLCVMKRRGYEPGTIIIVEPAVVTNRWVGSDI